MIKIRDGQLEFDVPNEAMLLEIWNVLTPQQHTQIIHRLTQIREQIPVPTIEVHRVIGGDGRP